MEKEAKEIWEMGLKLTEMVKAATNKEIALVLVLSVPRDDEDRKSDINNCMGTSIGGPMHLGHIMNDYFQSGDIAKFMAADILKRKLESLVDEEGEVIDDMDVANKEPI